MTHDPATLAAVRERIEALRIVGDIAKRGLSWIDARNSTVDEAIGRINVMIDSPDAEPPLTAAEVRRIVDERVANVLKLAGDPDAIRKLVDDALGKPPAPPQPAKRVEAWLNVYRHSIHSHPTLDEALAGQGAAILRTVYVREQHGVTDAASAEAFERAVREAHRAWSEVRATLNKTNVLNGPEYKRLGMDAVGALNALAPFLPDAPR